LLCYVEDSLHCLTFFFWSFIDTPLAFQLLVHTHTCFIYFCGSMSPGFWQGRSALGKKYRNPWPPLGYLWYPEVFLPTKISFSGFESFLSSVACTQHARSARILAMTPGPGRLELKNNTETDVKLNREPSSQILIGHFCFFFLNQLIIFPTKFL
jgi:hypothetical protein